MRWSAVLASLPPETAAVVNGLTLGYGQAALAGRRAASNASVTAIERALVAALLAWSRSVALLPAALQPGWVAPVLPDLATRPGLPAGSWQALLLSVVAGPLDTQLAEVLAVASRSAELIMADASVADSLAQLTVAAAAVVALRARLLALVDDDEPDRAGAVP
jgi:hypothetical protein